MNCANIQQPPSHLQLFPAWRFPTWTQHEERMQCTKNARRWETSWLKSAIYVPCQPWTRTEASRGNLRDRCAMAPKANDLTPSWPTSPALAHTPLEYYEVEARTSPHCTIQKPSCSAADKYGWASLNFNLPPNAQQCQPTKAHWAVVTLWSSQGSVYWRDRPPGCGSMPASVPVRALNPLLRDGAKPAVLLSCKHIKK